MEQGSLEKSRGSEFLDREQLWIAIDDQSDGLALVSGKASFLPAVFTDIDEKHVFHFSKTELAGCADILLGIANGLDEISRELSAVSENILNEKKE